MQIFTEKGHVVPVTVIEAGPCHVTQVRTVEKDGYSSVQLGFGEVKPRRLTKGELGHLSAKKVLPLRTLREFRAYRNDKIEWQVGQKITADVFAAGDVVDVTGVEDVDAPAMRASAMVERRSSTRVPGAMPGR